MGVYLLFLWFSLYATFKLKRSEDKEVLVCSFERLSEIEKFDIYSFLMLTQNRFFAHKTKIENIFAKC